MINKHLFMVFAISFTLRASEVEIKVTKTPERKELTPRLSKDQSKEIAKKINNILLDEANEHTELAMSRTLSKDPEYTHINLTDIRIHFLNQIDGDSSEIPLKDELSKWAIKELAVSHNHEREMRKKEQKRKMVAAIIAGIATVVSVAGPIITALLTTNNTTPACTNYTL